VREVGIGIFYNKNSHLGFRVQMGQSYKRETNEHIPKAIYEGLLGGFSRKLHSRKLQVENCNFLVRTAKF
jgi:hypothetical protein